MIALHFSFHHNTLTFLQIGWFAVMKNYFCFSTQTVNSVKAEVIGIVYSIVFNGFCFIEFGNQVYKCTLFLLSRFDGFVGRKVAC